MAEFNNNDYVELPTQKHFLPMDTNLFDRVFISVLLFVAINLLWLRFLEAFLPLWVAAAVSFVVAYFVVTRG